MAKSVAKSERKTERTAKRAGAYDLRFSLGRNRLGERYLARRQGAPFERLVEILLVDPQLVKVDAFRDAVTADSKIAIAVNHPKVGGLHEAVANPDEVYFVREYLAGQPLSALIARGSRGKPLGVSECARIIADTADGLDAFHNQHDSKGEPANLVHGCLDLEQIVILYNGGVKVIGHGLGRATTALHKAIVPFTADVAYRAPEVTSGRPDVRADVFSLGVLLWELLAGRRLVRDKTPVVSVLRKGARPASQYRNDVPDEVDRIVSQALALDPGARYQSARDMRIDIENYLWTTDYDRDSDSIASYMATVFASEIRAEQSLARQVLGGKPSADEDLLVGESEEIEIDISEEDETTAVRDPGALFGDDEDTKIRDPLAALGIGGVSVARPASEAGENARPSLPLPPPSSQTGPIAAAFEARQATMAGVAPPSPTKAKAESKKPESKKPESKKPESKKPESKKPEQEAERPKKPVTFPQPETAPSKDRSPPAVAAAPTLASRASSEPPAVLASLETASAARPRRRNLWLALGGVAVVALIAVGAVMARGGNDKSTKSAASEIERNKTKKQRAKKRRGAGADSPTTKPSASDVALLTGGDPKVEGAIDPVDDPADKTDDPADKTDDPADKTDDPADKTDDPADHGTSHEAPPHKKPKKTRRRPSRQERLKEAQKLYRRGVRQFVQGNTRAAKASFRAAIKLSSGYAPAHRGLGLVYERLRDPRAVRAYRTYLKLAPSAGDAASIRVRIKRIRGK